jgi:hypothetical protein
VRKARQVGGFRGKTTWAYRDFLTETQNVDVRHCLLGMILPSFHKSSGLTLSLINIKSPQNPLQILHANHLTFHTAYQSSISVEMSTPECPTVLSERGTVDAARLLTAGPESKELVKRVGLEAAERSSIILYNWVALRHILDRHEDTIRKRWTKKTRTRKKTVLHEAWGGEIPRLHRPDIEYLIKEATELKTDGVMRQRPMGEFKWPHINLEDLSYDKPMLCLLNTRARYPPAAFVYHEIQSCSLGLSSNTLVPLTLHGYAMYLEGETGILWQVDGFYRRQSSDWRISAWHWTVNTGDSTENNGIPCQMVRNPTPTTGTDFDRPI